MDNERFVNWAFTGIPFSKKDFDDPPGCFPFILAFLIIIAAVAGIS